MCVCVRVHACACVCACACVNFSVMCLYACSCLVMKTCHKATAELTGFNYCQSEHPLIFCQINSASSNNQIQVLPYNAVADFDEISCLIKSLGPDICDFE